MIRDLYNKILKLEDLSPSDEVNTLFSALVSESINPETVHDLNESEISKLQRISAESEYLMEVHWVKRIIQSNDPKQELENFWYYKNYVDLTKIEWMGLESCCDTSKHDDVLFMGSGPLPLTAIVLAKFYGCKISLLDVDEYALELSKKLIKALKLESKFQFIHSDATKFIAYERYEVIYVAALAGLDNDSKNLIVKNIRQFANAESHIIMRSSYANRTLLYRPLDERILNELKPLIEIRPHNEVVNSVFIFKNHENN